MNDFIQSGLVGIDLHVVHLKAVVLIMAAWTLASLLLGLLLGRAWQLFGYSDECSTEILRPPPENGGSPSPCGLSAAGTCKVPSVISRRG